MSTERSATRRNGGGGVRLDPVTLALVASIVLLGLVMVTSASISLAMALQQAYMIARSQ